MTAADIESISHLDFDIKEDDAIPCDGHTSLWSKSREVIVDGTCDAPAELYCFRACCGHLDSLCRKCYNIQVHSGPKLCRFCKNDRPNPKFSRMEFI